MSFIGNAVGSVLGGITGANQQADAAQSAAGTQAASDQSAINLQSSEFNQIQQLLAPYVGAGTSALGSYGNLAGTNGNAAQSAAIQQVQQSPLYQSQMASGKQALLQSASATGGLRGGNTQLALAGLGQSTLASTVQQTLANQQGLISTGLNAATGTGQAGQTMANNTGTLLQAQGAATAGGQIAAGNSVANTFNTAAKLGGTLASFF